MPSSCMILTNHLCIDGWQEPSQAASCDQRDGLLSGETWTDPEVVANAATLSSRIQLRSQLSVHLPGVLAP